MKIKVFNQYFTLGQIWVFRRSIFQCFFSRKRLVNLLITMLSYLTGNPRASSLPIILTIEPSSDCNLNCIMCPEVVNKPRSIKGEMPFEQYKKIIDEVGDHIFFLCLWNYGEPFMNKDIYGMINYAKSNSIFVAVNTNFSLLSESDVTRLVNSGLDYLTISLDATQEETYNTIKRGGDFKKTLHNIKLIIETRNNLNKSLPFVNLQFIVMKENEGEISEASSFANMLGVDRVSFKKVYNFNQRLNNLIPKNEKYSLNVLDMKLNSRPCRRLWLSSVILWNGDVLPCCYDFNFKYILGNISGLDAFKDVWRGREYHLFRKNNLKPAQRADICRDCSVDNFSTDLFLQN